MGNGKVENYPLPQEEKSIAHSVLCYKLLADGSLAEKYGSVTILG